MVGCQLGQSAVSGEDRSWVSGMGHGAPHCGVEGSAGSERSLSVKPLWPMESCHLLFLS